MYGTRVSSNGRKSTKFRENKSTGPTAETMESQAEW